MRQGNEPIITNEMDYQAIAQTSMEADFNKSKDSAARDICMIYSYPPQFLGLPDASAYKKQSEARRNFYNRAVIPKGQIFWKRFEQWIKQFTPEKYRDFRIVMDINSISAIAEFRAQIMTQLEGTSFLTINEKRVQMGLPKIADPNADIILVKGGMMPLGDATADVGGEPNGDDLDDNGE